MLTPVYHPPAGLVQAFAGTTIPDGWLECTGQAVSRATHARLFAVLGTTWGAGDGSTTFNVPDLRGRMILGVGTGSGLSARTLGGSGGAETHTLSTAEIPSHGHSVSSALPYSYTGTGTDTHNWTVSGGGNQFAVLGVTIDSAGGDGAHNNMPPWAALKFLIKT